MEAIDNFCIGSIEAASVHFMVSFTLVSERHAILGIGAEFTHWSAPALRTHYQSIAGFHAGFLANGVRHCYHGLHREYGPLVAALSQALKNRDE
jgi:hypothetical protein